VVTASAVLTVEESEKTKVESTWGVARVSSYLKKVGEYMISITAVF